MSLKEDGTEPVLRVKKSPPPEERVNLQRPNIRDLFSHSPSSQKQPTTNKNKSKSKEENARIEKLKEKFLRKGKKDQAVHSPSRPPPFKL